MASADPCDDEVELLKVEAEFRRACEAQRDFLAWYSSRFEVPFAESLSRYSEAIEAGEPWAASYRRISKEFPTYMERLHANLLPIQHEIFGTGRPPDPQQQPAEPRRLRRFRRRAAV
jgi:hypothetical protein